MQFYQGPSAINGRPIVSVFAGMVIPSANVKTGPVIQQFILSDEGVAPYQITPEQSEAICGSCPLQPSKSGGCYVTRVQGSNQVFRHVSKYPEFKATRLRGRAVRLGADGDPTAIPFDRYAPVFKNAEVIIGYTHNWTNCDQRWKKYLKASVETEEDYQKAKALGWYTFRIRQTVDDVPKPSEQVCLYESRQMQCIACQLCNKKTDIVVTAHGARKNKINYV